MDDPEDWEEALVHTFDHYFHAKYTDSLFSKDLPDLPGLCQWFKQ